MSDLRPLKMSIDLSALEHLGMNLYSNVPAVLSEVVANAWDADAKQVTIVIDEKSSQITIDDNGVGMTRNEVINQFLTVAFKRREKLGDITPLGRKPMGRKGIGKLSTFSIAQVVDVYTAKDGEYTAFSMDSDAIRKAISENTGSAYEPEEISHRPSDFSAGTRIVLKKLRKNITQMTFKGLKSRVARRFSIIGGKHQFAVSVNGSEIGPEDRGHHRNLEYVWTYGDQDALTSRCKNLKRLAVNRTKEVDKSLENIGFKLEGWIGTVSSPSKLSSDEGDNLNRIAVFMRGKMAQEDVLDDFGRKEIYADYVIGEIHCDALDESNGADIATSSRQSLKEDDERVMAIKEAILKELRNIAYAWTDWRREDGAKVAQSVPAVSEWLNALQGDTKKKAERWIGRLNTIRSADANDQKEILKASILAFESYLRKDQLDRLSEISSESVAEMLPIFKNIDDLEVSYYGQIVNMRLGVVKQFEKMVDEDAREKLIQKYIYDHLWLIDPSWERVSGTERLEKSVGTFLAADTKQLSNEEKTARIDISYRTASGSHVIVELKRSSVSTPIDLLTKQIRKYRTGVQKIIDTSGNNKDWPIEIICVVGKAPPEWEGKSGRTEVEGALAPLKARLVFYNELINNALKSYADYLDEHKKIDKLWNIFGSIDDFTPPEKAKK